MKSPAPLLLALASVLAGASATSQGTSEFGEPLLVDGVRISDLKIKRALASGLGRHALAAARMNAIVDSEWASRERARRQELLTEGFGGRGLDELGVAERARLDDQVERSLARFRYDEAELEAMVIEAERSFQERWPTLDHATEVRRRCGTMGSYLDSLRATLAFDQLFFPGHPDTWPEITIEAIHAGAPESDLVAGCANACKVRREAWLAGRVKVEQELLRTQFAGRRRDQLTIDEQSKLDGGIDAATGEFEPRDAEMMMSLLRDFVIDALTDSNVVTIQTSANGLAEDLLMTIERDGFRRQVATDDVYARVSLTVQTPDLARIKRFLVLMAAARGGLERAGHMLPDEELARVAHELESDDSPFDLEYVALHEEGFPSVEAYVEYVQLRECYRRSNALLPAVVGEPSAEFDAFLPVAEIRLQAHTRVEVLLVAAFDEEGARWKGDGWADAARRAQTVWARIDRELGVANAPNDTEPQARRVDASTFDVFWDELLENESGYWDPPMQRGPTRPTDVQDKGRFGQRSRRHADWGQFIGESRFDVLLDGDSIVDRIFFDLEPGQVGGPYLGPKGYYIVYLKSRQLPARPLDYGDEWTLSRIREEFVQVEFAEFCHECLERAEVSGL